MTSDSGVSYAAGSHLMGHINIWGTSVEYSTGRTSVIPRSRASALNSALVALLLPVTTDRKEIDVNDHHLTMEEIKGGVDLNRAHCQ